MTIQKIKMCYDLTQQHNEALYVTHPIQLEDLHELGQAMLDAFTDTIDYKGESLEDLIDELGSVIDGEFGPFINEASFAIKEAGMVIGTIMINIYKGEPLVSEIFTRKANTGKGVAAFLLRKSIQSLLDHGHERLVLYVHPSNIGAISLYRKIGFSVEL